MHLEFFGCAGGFAEGCRRAGLEFDLSFDKSPDAVASYEANLGRRPILMDVYDFARLLGFLDPIGPVDLIVADPPCTPWSRSGSRRGLEDPRDCLTITVELIRRLQPRCYLIGNVPGLEDESNWDVVQTLIGGLASDYCVRDFATLNAADYGVAQRRIRPFWFGHRSGPCIRWPAPTHCDPRLPSLFGDLKPWVTCRQALAHLPSDEIGKPVRMKLTPRNHKGSKLDEPARTLTGNTHSDGAVIVTDRHPPSNPDAPAHTILGRDRSCGGTLLSWPWDRVATCIHADPRIQPPGHMETSARLSDPNAVVLSERAATVLQGFPDGWVFSGKAKTTRWEQIGQAMPPPVAEAVARAVVVQMSAARSHAVGSLR